VTKQMLGQSKEEWNLKTEDVAMCCLVRTIAYCRSQWWLWGNVWMIINKEK